MNSAIASNINGGVISNQQVASGSHSTILLSSIDFCLSETKTNFSVSSGQGKYLIKFSGKVDALSDGNKLKNCDLNKNTIDNAYLSVNGNKEKNSEDSIPIPKIELYTGKINVEWNQVYKIGAGLNNLGNTCFMNTVIQCLTYCPPLANYLLHDGDHSSKCTVTGFCMMCLLQRHMKRTIGKTGEVIKPLDVYQRLKVIAKHFQFGRQEDAHEFLRYVIDHLWKSCLPQTNGVIKLDAASKETTVINKIFGGYHRSQVICLRCKKESNTFDHFMDFILDIKQNVGSLEKALEKFTQPELLQQENCYKCPKCKMKVEAQKRFSVYRAPTVATFQLKRFDYNRSFGGKITKQITYPEKLNLRPYMSETQGDPVWYRLNAVLVHSGGSCNTGHYYCYVKNSNNLWYIMDDSRVHQVSLNQVLNQSAYVLFYIKMENTDRPLFKKCLDNKSSYLKGAVSNSHFSKIPEMGNVKTTQFGDKISPLVNAKSFNSPNTTKKLNHSLPCREKISFTFRNNSPSVTLTPPKNRVVSSEPTSASRGGLVPYIEDSSESSDANESISTQPNYTVSESKLYAKSCSIDSYKHSTPLEIKSKLSKSLSISSSITKVNATSPWIVTDAPQTPTCSTSNSSGVNSTTDWHVIEAASPKLTGSPRETERKDYNKMESDDSSKLSMPILPTSSKYPDIQEDLSPAKKLTGFENNPSAQKCNFRKQIFKNKTSVSENEETVYSPKRKFCSAYTKSSSDSPYFEHNESRHNPVSKKVKYSENSTFLNQENGIKNSCSKIDIVDSNSGTSSSVQRHYSASNCDNLRTSQVNGVSRHNETSWDVFNQNSNILNGTSDHTKDSPEKDGVFSKGKHKDSFISLSSKSSSYEKGKTPVSNEGKNTSLYGTEVPTWRGENHYRPSIISAHERRSFDNYDHEFDRGKMRKSKMKDRYQHFNRKNMFQKYSDRNGKHNGKIFTHHNHRKYDSHHGWKSNHVSYQRNRNHQRRHYQ